MTKKEMVNIISEKTKDAWNWYMAADEAGMEETVIKKAGAVWGALEVGFVGLESLTAISTNTLVIAVSMVHLIRISMMITVIRPKTYRTRSIAKKRTKRVIARTQAYKPVPKRNRFLLIGRTGRSKGRDAEHGNNDCKNRKPCYNSIELKHKIPSKGVIRMNPYIATHIFNAQAMARNFEQTCQQAAKQDDGKVSKEEEKMLKKIHDITARFISDLSKLS